MWPWLFTRFMDKMVKEVTKTNVGERGEVERFRGSRTRAKTVGECTR